MPNKGAKGISGIKKFRRKQVNAVKRKKRKGTHRNVRRRGGRKSR